MDVLVLAVGVPSRAGLDLNVGDGRLQRITSDVAGGEVALHVVVPHDPADARLATRPEEHDQRCRGGHDITAGVEDADLEQHVHPGSVAAVLQD